MIVAITMYTATVGAPLYCGGIYAPATEFVAWPFDVAGGECGDIIRIEAGGTIREYPALDSGAFGHHCVRQLDGSCPSIAVDVPQHLAWWHGLSAVGRVVNLSERARYEEYPQ